MAPDPRILERNIAKLLSRSYKPAQPKPAFRTLLKQSVLALVEEPRLLRRTQTRRLVPMLAIAAGFVLAIVLWRALVQDGDATPDALLARGEIALRTEPQGLWHAAEATRTIAPANAFLEVATPTGRTFHIETLTGACELREESRLELATTAGGNHDAPTQAWLHAGGCAFVMRSPLRVATHEGAVRFDAGELALAYAPSPLPETDAGRDVVRLDVAPSANAVRVDDAPQALAVAAGAWVLFERSVRSWPGADDSTTVTTTASAPTRIDPAASEVESSPDRDLNDPGLIRIRVTDARTRTAFDSVTYTLLELERILGDGRRVPAYGQLVTARTESTDEGVLELYAPEDGVYKLFVRAPGYATWQSERFEATSTSPARTFDAELDAGASVSGRVVDARGGAPIPNAVVLSEVDTPALGVPVDRHWYSMFGIDRVTSTTTTAEDGSFVLEHVSRGEQRLRVIASGFGSQQLRMSVPAAGIDLAPVVIELGQAATLFGRVTDRDGKPRANEMVVAAGQHQAVNELAAPLGFAMTDADGRFRIVDLAAGAWIVIHMADADAGPLTAGQSVRSVGVDAGESVEVNFGSGKYRVRGLVLQANGTPLTQATLSLSHETELGPENWIGVNTDDQGRFEVGLDRTGEYSAVIVELAGQRISVIGKFDVRDEPECDVTLRIPTATISGRVLRAETGDPVAFASLVILESKDGRCEFSGVVVADAEGRFQTAPFAATGTYDLMAVSSTEALGIGLARGIQVTIGQSATGVELRMPRGGSLVVAPQDESGAAIPAAKVELVDARGVVIDLAQTTARDEKRFAGVDATRWTVRVTADGFETLETHCDVAVGAEARVVARLVRKEP
jgi:hypothetical protein